MTAVSTPSMRGRASADGDGRFTGGLWLWLGALLRGPWRNDKPGAAFDRGCRAHARGDSATAAEAWSQAARAGHAEAQFRLGMLYEAGDGVLPQIAEAAAWHRRAAEQGHVDSRTRLATLYLCGGRADPPALDRGLGALYPHGTSLAHDPAEARHWATLAAEQGSVPAQALLGYLLAAGLGGPADPHAAERWYRLAAAEGSAEAAAGLGTLLAGGYLGVNDYEGALAFFRQAATQGNATAWYSLAVLYEEGLGVPADRGQAADAYRQAANRGHVLAQQAFRRLQPAVPSDRDPCGAGGGGTGGR